MSKAFHAPRTPGPEQGTCWACGRYTWISSLGYCKECTLAGKDSPMISCSGCGSVKRRTVPGQQSFTCPSCKPKDMTVPQVVML